MRQFILPKYPTPTDDYFYLDTDLEPTHRFSDPINRNAWHVMMYSPDGEWLAGGASDNATHKIYIWDIVNDGRFTSTLDGGREPLLHAHVSTSLLYDLTTVADYMRSGTLSSHLSYRRQTKATS